MCGAYVDLSAIYHSIRIYASIVVRYLYAISIDRDIFAGWFQLDNNYLDYGSLIYFIGV